MGAYDGDLLWIWGCSGALNQQWLVEGESPIGSVFHRHVDVVLGTTCLTGAEHGHVVLCDCIAGCGLEGELRTWEIPNAEMHITPPGQEEGCMILRGNTVSLTAVSYASVFGGCLSGMYVTGGYWTLPNPFDPSGTWCIKNQVDTQAESLSLLAIDCDPNWSDCSSRCDSGWSRVIAPSTSVVVA